MTKFTKEEVATIEKFFKYRGFLWFQAIKEGPWDSLESLDPKTLEFIRMGFITGVWYCVKEEYEEDRD